MTLQVMRPESTENSRAHRIIDYLSVFILVLLIFIIKITAITHERTSAIINVVHTSHIMPLSAAATNENPHATGSTKSVCLHIDITSDCSPESSAWNTPSYGLASHSMVVRHNRCYRIPETKCGK